MSSKIAYGDFQTPLDLALAVCKLLRKQGVDPASVIEPTCGKGNFVIASLQVFEHISDLFCLEYNSAYVDELTHRISQEEKSEKVRLRQGDFFKQDWASILASASEPTLIIGNPPWVTNATLGKLNGTNLPPKSNFQGHTGFDALTGKSNFDISEWMLIHLLEWASRREATVAFLCKTAVARKVVKHRWKHRLKPYRFSMYEINALQYFGASVDACLFVAETTGEVVKRRCPVYRDLHQPVLKQEIGISGDALISDIEKFARTRDLLGQSAYVWRSGIKHDCSKIMELAWDEKGRWQNKLDEVVDIEDTYVYPLLKSSDVAKGCTQPRRFVLVTQQTTGEDTSQIQDEAPETWTYLISHAKRLNARGSSIYRNRPPFSIFGIGPYSFSPWKVAVSGLYKKLQFTVVGPIDGKPVMLDDTCYFLSCESEEEAVLLKHMLDDELAVDLYHSFIFWDEKRPITVDLLSKLDLLELATRLGLEEEYMRFVSYNPHTEVHKKQLLLIREEDPDLTYERYMLEKIQPGRKDAEKGRVVSQEEANQRLNR
jgi:hypothetical protein